MLYYTLIIHTHEESRFPEPYTFCCEKAKDLLCTWLQRDCLGTFRVPFCEVLSN